MLIGSTRITILVNLGAGSNWIRSSTVPIGFSRVILKVGLRTWVEPALSVMDVEGVLKVIKGNLG